MRATAQNPVAAQLMGIKVNQVIAVTFLIGGRWPGHASVIYALKVHTVNFLMGFQNGLYAFTAVVLGGIGNIPGGRLRGGHRRPGLFSGERFCRQSLGDSDGFSHHDCDSGVPAAGASWGAGAGEGMRAMLNRVPWAVLVFVGLGRLPAHAEFECVVAGRLGSDIGSLTARAVHFRDSRFGL